MHIRYFVFLFVFIVIKFYNCEIEITRDPKYIYFFYHYCKFTIDMQKYVVAILL